jgi:hypothetical protein
MIGLEFSTTLVSGVELHMTTNISAVKNKSSTVLLSFSILAFVPL